MKKLILIILLFVSVSASAQYLESAKINTAKAYTWTGNNTFKGITTIDSLIVKTPLKTDSSDIVVKGIFTAADSTYDIGNSTNAFRDAYIDGYVYLAGNATTDGSWRFYGMLNGDLIFEYRASGNWVEKSRITK